MAIEESAEHLTLHVLRPDELSIQWLPTSTQAVIAPLAFHTHIHRQIRQVTKRAVAFDPQGVQRCVIDLLKRRAAERPE